MIFIFDYLRGAGTIAGLATGDALGAPLEGLPPKKTFVKRMISGGIHNTTAGDITDDTLQALAVAESLIEKKGFFEDDIAVRMYREYMNYPVFFGPTSTTVFKGMQKGEKPEIISRKLYKNGGGRSNGSVMRGAPIGVFFSPDKTRTYSIACSQITHYHPVACECTAFINSMVSRLCRGENKKKAFEKALSECENKEAGTVLSKIHSYPLRPSLDSLDATHCAVSVFMQSDNFEEMLVQAVNLGGDADTVGAVCGALGGACWGYQSIPKNWLMKLKIIERIENTAFKLAKSVI